MHRRPLLALLGAGLASGCSMFTSASTRTQPTTVPRPTETAPTGTPTERSSQSGSPDRFPDRTPMPPTGQRWSQVTLETVPRSASLAPARYRTPENGEVRVRFTETATTHHPAVIRGTVTNRYESLTILNLHSRALFQAVPRARPGGRSNGSADTSTDAVLLAPTSYHDIAEAIPSVELASDGRWRLSDPIDGPWLPERLRLAPGDTFQFEYALVGHPDGRGFPSGRYEFQGDEGVAVTVWSSATPGPTTDSRFDGETVASLPGVMELHWYHTANESTPTYLEPSAERLSLPGSIGFTFVNHSRDRASGNPSFWRLWKHVKGTWYHIAPTKWPLPLVIVPPGGTVDWSFTGSNGPFADCQGTCVGYLGGGRYAFETNVARGDRHHAALLTIEAPPVTVEPTDGLEVTRDGGTVSVEWPQREDRPRGTLQVVRSPVATTTLIPEQVMQPRNRALRNTLPYFEEGVDRVVLTANESSIKAAVPNEDGSSGQRRFRYRGRAYEAQATI